MVFNYFLTSIRNIYYRKFFALINIIGFSIGICIFLLIIQYVRFELSYDKFHTKIENIYRIRYDNYQNGSISYKSAKAFPAMALALKSEIPEIKNSTRIWNESGVFKYKDLKFIEPKVYFVDSTFVDMFTLEMANGQSNLSGINTLLLSETMSRKYFADEDPISKIIFYRNKPYEVRGVFKNIPNNSHLKFDFLLPYAAIIKANGEGFDNNWWANYSYVYLELKDNVKKEIVESKIPALVLKYKGDQSKNNIEDKFYLQPLKDIHLKSDLIEELEPNGDYITVVFFLIISIIILIIACVNYVNLSTSLVLERAKEVGVRKVLGAFPSHLRIQFILESILITLLSCIIAVLFVILVGPYFNELLGKNIINSIFLDGGFLFTLFIAFIIGSLLSGLYPAFILSSFQPEETLKGKYNPKIGKVNFRQVLIIFQFASSSVLIIATIVMLQQIKFMQGKNIGLNIKRTLVVVEPGIVGEDSSFINSFEYFKHEVKRNSIVKGITSSSYVPGQEVTFYFSNAFRKATATKPDPNTYYVVHIDYDFIPSFDIKLASGRNYVKEMKSDYESVIMNEAAAISLGFEKPEMAVNKDIYMWENKLKIIGVIKNFNQRSLKNNPDPSIYILNADARAPFSMNFYSVKLETNNYAEAIDFIKSKWELAFPTKPFDYFFLDKFYNDNYKGELRMSKVFSIFSIFAIFIASLGLLGLASFTTLQRMKEIAIRKVHGASPWNIFLLISKDFAILILMANLIAWPIAYILLNNWLNNYAYHISLNILIFFLAGILSLVITLLSVSYFIIKASKVDPTQILKDE